MSQHKTVDAMSGMMLISSDEAVMDNEYDAAVQNGVKPEAIPHPDTRDKVNGLERTTTQSSVELGLGKRKATLYLSRTASMMRVPEKPQYPANVPSSNTEIGKPPSPDDQSKTEITTFNEANPVNLQKVIPEQPTADLGREFTFTGYDIMADVVPVPETRSKSQKEINRAGILYRATCRQLGITPASYFAQRILEPEIKMKSHGLGPIGAKAIAVALVNNNRVTTLDLEDNWIGAEGVQSLTEMLTENSTITDLGVGGNQIGLDGMRAISEVMGDHQFITRLDISGNDLADPEARMIQRFLETNTYLMELKASHNMFGEDGGVYLGRALAKNNTLTVVDVSWNHLRGKGAIAIATSLQKNVGLKVLNVAWNGFGTNGCSALRKALKVNVTLSELDLSCNRVDMNGVGHIMNGIQHNGSVRVLHLGQNPLTPSVCVTILRAVESSKKTVLETLDLMDTVVDKEFEDVLKMVQDKMPLKVITGAAIRNSEVIHQDGKGMSATDPIKLMFEYMSREGLRIIDLFTSLDKDGSRSVSHKEFRDGLLSVNVPLTEDQIDRLIDSLDKDKDGEVDFSELIKGERVYKRQQLRLKMKQEQIVKQKRRERKAERDREKAAIAVLEMV